MKTKPKKLTRAVARKVLAVVDAGLVRGVGNPKPGEMCVEAAVCYALGEPHGDRPSCVGDAVRAFKIELNDSAWSSDAARAVGMRRVAVAQLGSIDIDQKTFVKEVAEQTIRQIVPVALRAVAKLIPTHAQKLEEAAVRCEAEGTQAAANAAANAANAAYAANAAAYAANAAARAAAYAANATDAARAAANAANAAANAAAYAANAAAYAANAAARAAAYAARDGVLALAAQIAVNALAKLGCEGAKWLDLAA